VSDPINPASQRQSSALTACRPLHRPRATRKATAAGHLCLPHEHPADPHAIEAGTTPSSLQQDLKGPSKNVVSSAGQNTSKSLGEGKPLASLLSQSIFYEQEVTHSLSILELTG